MIYVEFITWDKLVDPMLNHLLNLLINPFYGILCPWMYKAMKIDDVDNTHIIDMVNIMNLINIECNDAYFNVACMYSVILVDVACMICALMYQECMEAIKV